jgi:hypothetical protein
MTELTNITADLASGPHVEKKIPDCSKQSKNDTIPEEEVKIDEKGNYEELRGIIMDSLKNMAEDEASVETSFNAMISIFKNEIEDLIRVGLEAFQRADSCEKVLHMLQEELDRKTAELERFRAADEKNSSAISVCCQSEYYCKVLIIDRTNRSVRITLILSTLKSTFFSLPESPSRSRTNT